MALTTLETELVAVAISVAAGCRPCTTFHLGAARKAGADDAAIERAVADALCVRNSATDGMKRHALALDPVPAGCGCELKDRIGELASLGAAIAVNCTENIASHLTAAHKAGATQNEITAVIALATKIRSVAIGHAEAAVTGEELPQRWGTTAPASSPCCQG